MLYSQSTQGVLMTHQGLELGLRLHLQVRRLKVKERK